MSRAANAGKATIFTMALLGLAFVGGIGLANYAESGAFSFYKERQLDGQFAAAAPATSYSSSSTAVYGMWAARPAAIEGPPVAQAAIQDSYDGASEDGSSPGPDFEQPAPDPQALSEAQSSQTQPELPSPAYGSDTGESSTVGPAQGSVAVPAPASDPVPESEDLQD